MECDAFGNAIFSCSATQIVLRELAQFEVQSFARRRYCDRTKLLIASWNMKALSNPLPLLAIFWAAGSFAKGVIVEEGAWVADPERIFVGDFIKRQDVSVDHPSSGGYEVYGRRGLNKELDRLEVPHFDLHNVDLFSANAASYPTPEQIEDRLESLHQQYSKLTRLFSIGQSAQGRKLWVMKISKNPELDEVKPEVKYISSMHGDEIAGRELLMNWIEELLKNYSSNAAIKSFVDNTEIFIMPSMNPDGSQLRRRGNGNNVDLNRDFPNIVSGEANTPDGRQPETAAVMAFQAQRKFVLSANFHGGSEVVNYPWDSKEELHGEDELFQQISLAYASHVPYISQSREFEGGITNGFKWYQVLGGMQDWSNVYYGDMQVTIELTHDKWPDFSLIEGYYKSNRNGLFEYLKLAHQGAGFSFVRPALSGRVKIESLDRPSEVLEASFSGSEYYKVLKMGRYRFSVTEANGNLSTFETEVRPNQILPGGNYTHLQQKKQ